MRQSESPPSTFAPQFLAISACHRDERSRNLHFPQNVALIRWSDLSAMRPSFSIFCALSLGLLPVGCSTPSPTPASGAPQAQDVTTAKTDPAAAVDVRLLLSMSYAEAATMAAQKMELPSGIKIAADKIEVLKTNAAGPMKVRATGHVFLQVTDTLPYTAMSQEALVNGSDIILRGRPVTQRGVSLVEGVSDVTMFYLVGSQLRVIGRHQISNVTPRPPADSGLIGSFGELPLPFADAGPWKAGANPLLPPLDDSAVPEALRNELRKAAEAEAVLQQTKKGVPPAFPEAKKSEAKP